MSWTHEEAKNYTVIERLRERCRTYGGGKACDEKNMPSEDWCERCLARKEIEGWRDNAHGWEVLYNRHRQLNKIGSSLIDELDAARAERDSLATLVAALDKIVGGLNDSR